MAESETRAE
jgi:hypothetical protein